LFKKLKIFSDKSWLPQSCNHVIMLYPFWGDIPLIAIDPDFGRFDDYIVQGNQIFEVVDSIEKSDFTVLPFEYSFEASKIDIAKKAAHESKLKGKKMILFFNSDEFKDILVDNSIIFRTSFFKSQQRANEFAFPGWSIDFLKKDQPTDFILPKEKVAKLSYCGYVDYLKEPKRSIIGKIKALFVSIPKENIEYGSYIRGRAVRTLLGSTLINTDFIIRDGFWAQGITDKLKVRQEYIKNMFNSPYAFVSRGAGNFSYRLYEVMSCGRIPVFVNTDSVLPFENEIDWKKQMVWIKEADINKMALKISDFHNSVSEIDFLNLQKQNRHIYETYLSPVGFFKQLHKLV
jgi:hypothetical protein